MFAITAQPVLGICFPGLDVAQAAGKMAQPLVKIDKVKKRTKKFVRHQTDRKIAVKVCQYERTFDDHHRNQASGMKFDIVV